MEVAESPRFFSEIRNSERISWVTDLGAESPLVFNHSAKRSNEERVESW